jgi:anaerobic selenocysteine-containing dehydrogenase
VSPEEYFLEEETFSKKEISDSNGITRRDFCKVATTMGAALALPISFNNTLLKSITPEEVRTAQQQAGQVKSTIVGYGQHGSISGNIAWTDVKDGRILRIRSLYYDWNYPKVKTWTSESHGMKFTPRMHSTPNYTAFGYKHRVYSPNRVLYPFKRVDWDPKGKRNEENRGRSPFVRISWDEALETLATEIKRVKETYGSAAIFYY